MDSQLGVIARDPVGAAPADRLPLAVDLDAVVTDVFCEGLCTAFRRNPAAAAGALLAVVRGTAALRRAIGLVAPLDAGELPYNGEVVAYLRRCRAGGRAIGLFTAADQTVACAVAEQLGVFDVALGSDGTRTLTGRRKIAAIERAFGSRFAYLGREAARARPRPTLYDWARSLRLEHWAKNLLLFAPAILAPGPFWASFRQIAPLFLIFGALASATYQINDLLDLGVDRATPQKCDRPLASGRIALRHGMLASAALLVVAVVSAGLWLPPRVILVLAGYFALTLAYSFSLKRRPIADVLALAGLFTSRILAGSWMISAPASPWLISFSLLFFLSLAMLKRYAELAQAMSAGAEGIASRGYTAADLPLLLAAGVGSAFASGTIVAVGLIQAPFARTYGHPHWLWAMTPVLLGWMLHAWRRAAQGQMNADPVRFALSDRASLGLAAIAGAILIAAWV